MNTEMNTNNNNTTNKTNGSRVNSDTNNNNQNGAEFRAHQRFASAQSRYKMNSRRLQYQFLPYSMPPNYAAIILQQRKRIFYIS
jgi:hypothetical protein